MSDVALTGLAVNEYLAGLDFRPATGQLYAVTRFNTMSRVVTIDTDTGAVASVGSVLSQPLNEAYGMDFDPVSDTIRLVDWRENNIRINPDDGAIIGTDFDLAYVPGDPGIGHNPDIVHIAYDRSISCTGTTTLLGLDFQYDVLVRIGGFDGEPSANTGALTSIGPMGITTFTQNGGFDIDSETGSAFAVVPIQSNYRLYRIDLTSGAAALIGSVNGGIAGIAIAPVQRIFSNGFE